MKVNAALQSVHRLFFDSSAVIYYIDENLAYLAVMDFIFDQVDANLIRAVTSPVRPATSIPQKMGHKTESILMIGL